MWIKASTQLSEHVFQLTTAVSSHLLVRGEKTALIDSSISAVSKRLRDEIFSHVFEPSGLHYILITHTHFDHISGLALLRRHFPQAELVCSSESALQLSEPAYLEYCYRRDRECASALNDGSLMDFSEWSCFLGVSRTLVDRDVLRLGSDDDVTLQAFSCPGHSKDSLVFYIRPDAVLAAGEALGIYGGRDRVHPVFSENYEQYLSALEKLSRLDLSAIGFPHNGAITGTLAKNFMNSALFAAEQFAREIRMRLVQGESSDQVYENLLEEWTKGNICPEGPFVFDVGETLKKMIQAVV